MALPAQINNFISGARTNRRPSQQGDTAFLKFSGKTGQYVLGRDEIDLDEEDLLIVNSLSLSHGFVRWGEKPPAKVFASIASELPEAPVNFQGVDENGNPKTYTPMDARLFSGRFIDDDLGEFSFEVNSMGGVERVDDLYDAILDRAETGTEYVFPIVSLGSDWWKRATGKVFKPIFNVVGWADQNGKKEGEEPEKIEAPEPDPQPEQEAEKPTRRKRRR